MSEPYRFAIKKSSTVYYAINSQGNVITQTEAYYFEGYNKSKGKQYEGIANWDEIGINDVRDSDMSGFFRNYGNDYQFYNGAAKVIRHIYYTHGVSASAILEIERLNLSTHLYEPDGTTNIDLSEIQDERDNVTVSAMQAGVQEKIKANQDIEYEIPVTGANSLTVRIAPFRLKGSAKYLTTHQNAAGNSDTQGNQQGGPHAWMSIMQYAEEYAEFNSSDNTRVIDYADETAPREFIRGQQIIAGTTGVWGTTPGSYQNFLFRNNIALENVRITLTLPSFIKNNSGGSSLTVSARIYRYNEAVANSEASIATFSLLTLAAGAQSSHTFNIDHTFNLPANHRVYIVLEATHAYWEWNWEKDHKVEVTFEYFSEAFRVRGISLNEVFKQLVAKVTDGQATASSSLLTTAISYEQGIDCRPDKVVLLSGSSIKGLANAKLKISLSKFLKAMDTMFCAAMGQEDNVVRLEKRSYYFQEKKAGTTTDNKIADIQTIKSTMFEHADDIMYSELHIGYAVQDEDDLNGKEEFNTTVKLTTSYAKVSSIKTMVSPVSAAGFDIYRTYLKYIIDTNKDTGGDDKLFVLQHVPSPTVDISGIYYNALYPRDIKPSAYVEGLTDNYNCLNIGLSPAHCYSRGAYWHYSHFYDSDPTSGVYLFKYQTQDRNSAMKCRISTSITLATAQSIDIKQYAETFGMQRLFYPIKITTETSGVANYRLAWAANRYGYFSQYVAHKKATVKGFPIESAEQNAEIKEQTFIQLLTASNNLEELIK